MINVLGIYIVNGNNFSLNFLIVDEKLFNYLIKKGCIYLVKCYDLNKS